jgi:hypothetical protein
MFTSFIVAIVVVIITLIICHWTYGGAVPKSMRVAEELGSLEPNDELYAGLHMISCHLQTMILEQNITNISISRDNGLIRYMYLNHATGKLFANGRMSVPWSRGV